MKKHLVSVLCLILGIALGVCGCFIVLVAGESSGRGQLPQESPSFPRESGLQDSELTAMAYTVAGLIREGDYRTLASYIHPVYGLVFAPNATVNLTSNQCFTPNRVAYTAEDSTIYVWGTRYGTDEPIQLTTAQYFYGYVYNRDYIHAPLVGVNHIVKSGNALENVTAVFPEGKFVDFCFPGGTDGNGWSTLRIVFEPYEGEMKLSALIHSEYTE